MNTKADSGTSDTTNTKLTSLAEVVVRLRELPLEHALRSVELPAEPEVDPAGLAAGRSRSGVRWQINLPDEPRLLA